MLAVHVVSAPFWSVVVITLVAVVPPGIKDVVASESAIEVELTSLPLTPVPEGEMLVPLPPGTE
jgi:hypothetical protein